MSRRFSRYSELGKELIEPQLCQIFPNQTRGEETQAEHQGLPDQGNRERKEEGRYRFYYYFSNLVSDCGQEHRFKQEKKAVTVFQGKF